MTEKHDTLFLVGAGALHCYTIHESHAIGLRVLCTDRNPHAPGFALADEGIICDVYNAESHRALATKVAQEHHIVGVSCAGGDAAPTVAAVAEVLGLPGIPYAVAERTWNKYEVRHALERMGLSRYQPRWCDTDFRTDAITTPTVQHALAEWGPLVIKPVSQRASRGVSLLNNHYDAEYAWKKAHVADPQARLFLMEQQLTGSEHSAELIFSDDGCEHFHVCDRFFSYADGIPLELGHINPTSLSLEKQLAIKRMLFECASAIGVGYGSFKADVIYTTDGPKILEVASRCSGGYDAQVSYPRSSGDNLLRRVLQVACHMPVMPQPVLPQGQYCAIAAIIPQKAGTVQTLPDLGAEVLWHCKPGDRVQPPAHCAERAGFVAVDGPLHQETWQVAWQLARDYAAALAEVTT